MRKERGVALVVVMMILALVVVIAVQMSGRLQLQLQRQANRQDQQQVFWYGMAAEQAAVQLLKRAVVGQERVNLSQDWANLDTTFAVDGGTITGQLKDLQTCFNLNNLQRPESENRVGSGQSYDQQAFEHLLQLKVSDLSMPAEYLMARVSDWVDSDSTLQSSGGAEDNDYAGLRLPYYAANSLMGSVSELRAILDVTPTDFEHVRPFVCVIPQNRTSKINLNTVTSEQSVLLSAYIPELTEDAASEIISNRPQAGFENVSEVWQSPQLQGKVIPEDVKERFVLTSNYFVLESTVSYRESVLRLASVLHINEKKQVKVIARRFGEQW